MYNVEQNVLNFWWCRKVSLVSLTELQEHLQDQKSNWITRIHNEGVTHKHQRCVYKLWNLASNSQNTHVKIVLNIFVGYLKLLAIKEHWRRTKEAKEESVNKRPSWFTLVTRLNRTRAHKIYMATKLVVALMNEATNKSVGFLFLIWGDSMDRSKV